MDYYIEQIEKLKLKIEEAPKGKLTFKKIKNHVQPYLQWTEAGKTKCAYIRQENRKKILAEIEERDRDIESLHYLQSYREKIRDVLEKSPCLSYRNVAIGEQSFHDLIVKQAFYVDKTQFIKDWWEGTDKVTLITRPRRFGKTLMLDMVNCFFSNRYAGQGALFQGLNIWNYDSYHDLQGTYPTIMITLANIKSKKIRDNVFALCYWMIENYNNYTCILDGNRLSEQDKSDFVQMEALLRERNEDACIEGIPLLCRLLEIHYQKSPIILLDEYDTPLHEAYTFGTWDESMDFFRRFYTSVLKTNRHYSKALMTGITRVAKESLFSDLNHLNVYTVSHSRYADVCGFTEEELKQSLICQDWDAFDTIKKWYDGFTFGGKTHIYNPWSITCYMCHRQTRPYWADTSSNALLGPLFLKADNRVKRDLMTLVGGGSIHRKFSENINFMVLEKQEDALWALLVATGYLRMDNVNFTDNKTECDLSITNFETMAVFDDLIERWFLDGQTEYNEFCRLLLQGDLEGMNEYMNYLTLTMVSYFDVGRRPSEKAPERFYHGLVLGLMVDLRDKYEILSNRESGAGRFDIMLCPKQFGLDGIIIEFKVHNEKREADLTETAVNALRQIEEKNYETELLERGIQIEQIQKYGFAFAGKQVLILKG